MPTYKPGKKKFILMSIETPVIAVSVGGEYIEYVCRYDPLEEGNLFLL